MWWCDQTRAPDPNDWDQDISLDPTDIWIAADEVCTRFRETGARIMDHEGETQDYEDDPTPVECNEHRIEATHLEYWTYWRRAYETLGNNGWTICQTCLRTGEEEGMSPYEWGLAANADALIEHMEDAHGEDPEEEAIDFDWDPQVVGTFTRATTTHADMTVRDINTGTTRLLRWNPVTARYEEVRPPAETLHGAFNNG